MENENNNIKEKEKRIHYKLKKPTIIVSKSNYEYIRTDKITKDTFHIGC